MCLYEVLMGVSVSPPGMPAAYDLSTVIGSGPSVSHNNLIPLGTNRTPPDFSTSNGTYSGAEHTSPVSTVHTGRVSSYSHCAHMLGDVV